MKRDILAQDKKLLDLLSRINGGEFEIPRLDDVSINRDRRVDKVCIAISLIKRRFGNQIKKVTWALFKFIAHCNFRYGVRSLTHLIDCIPRIDNKEVLKTTDLKLPLNSPSSLKNSSLAYHIKSDDGPAGVTKFWAHLKESKGFVLPQIQWLDMFKEFDDFINLDHSVKWKKMLTKYDSFKI